MPSSFGSRRASPKQQLTLTETFRKEPIKPISKGDPITGMRRKKNEKIHKANF